MENATNYWDKAAEMVMTFAPKVILAIVVLIIGFWIIKRIVKPTGRVMEQKSMDASLQKFLSSLISIVLKVMLLISVASIIGIATTSFVAVLGAAGLAVGLALQGSLANFAGGVLILMFKPYKVGDVIDAQGHIGRVDSIQIFNTVLKTPDNKTIIIPNGPLSNGSITNVSTEPQRRVDMTFGIGYSDDILKTKDVLKNIIDNDTRILKDPAPAILVSELADSSVNFAVRVWCNSADYWGIYFDMHENVKLTFDKEKISIPFPQWDVHMFQN